MSADTEMSRLDSLPTETLNSLISLANSLPTSIKSPKDGDVLVYDGTSKKWKNGEGGGSGGVFWVTFTKNEETGEFSADKTHAEILTAQSNGQYVVGRIVDSGLWYSYLQVQLLPGYAGADEPVEFGSISVSPAGNELGFTIYDYKLLLNADDTIEVEDTPYPSTETPG